MYDTATVPTQYASGTSGTTPYALPGAEPFPVLGYTTFWRINTGASVEHARVRQLFDAAGFKDCTPDTTSYRVALRRGIEDWVKGGIVRYDPQGPVAAKPDFEARTLLRVINKASSTHLVFALVNEDVDYAALGLDYSTEVRFLLNKEVGDLTVVSNGMLPQVIEGHVRPRYLHHRTHTSGADIADGVRDCITALSAVALRPRGGVYFVPGACRPRLLLLKDMLQVLLPGASLTMLPVPDSEAMKQELGQGVHDALLDELDAMAKELDRLRASAPGSGTRTSTVARKLVEYKEMRAKVRDYHNSLSVRRADLDRTLDDLGEAALALIEGN